MDRFSNRLAATIIEDRHREATEMRRSAELRASAAPGHATWRAPIRHLRPRRSIVVAAAVALCLAGSVASTASAVPVERTRSTIECLGTSATLIMHPGESAIVQWDISVEDVRNAPSFLIRSLTADVYVNGAFVTTFSASFGKKTGLGEPLDCTFEVHNGAVDVYGTSELVQL